MLSLLSPLYPIGATMPRRRNADPPVATTINLPKSVKESVESHLAHPFTGQMPKGALGGLITSLLNQWIKEKEEL